MLVNVINLCKASDYKLTYFHQLLSRYGISNRILLNNDDLIKLRDNVKISIKNQKSYKLYIELDRLIDDNERF